MRVQSFALIVVLVSTVFLASCASYFKRKECEKTNWYQHGYNVAMGGKRMDADNFVKECEKVESEINYAELDTGFKSGMGNYCKPDTVFATGKKGEFFSPEMCDGSPLRRLKARHKAGVREYCSKDNGFDAGSTGKAYNKICPKDLEKKFLKEFSRGRKEFLIGMVEAKEQEVVDVDGQIRNHERELRDLRRQQSYLPSGKTRNTTRTYDPRTKTYKENVTYTEDDETKRKRDQLTNDISWKSRKIQDLRNNKKKLKAEIREFRREMRKLR